MQNFDRLFLMALVAMANLVTFAQDTAVTGSTTTKTTTTETWYAQPWMWIVGAAVFILLLVALLKGNKK